LVKSARAYKSSKRSRELARQKKQEEKRLRRLAKHEKPQDDEAAAGLGPELEQGQDSQPGNETPGDGTPEGA
jgi:hypothetical protein